MSEPTKPPSPQWTPPPEVQKAMHEFFVINKGQLPSRLSSHAYYSEKYAIRARDIIDTILTTRRPIIIPAEPTITVSALRNQWYEGVRYLKKYLDPSGAYTKALTMIRCNRAATYIQISPRAILTMEETTPAIAPLSAWRNEFMEWLSAEPELETKFQRTKENNNMIFTDEDIAWGHEKLIGLEKLFIYEFTRNKVLVIRFNS